MADTLPSHASVVVIGGGIMGCTTLYHLANMGVSDAILLERNALTSGTTWHSAAQVRALRHSRNLTRMIQYSVELYSQLGQETGQSVGWIQKGSGHEPIYLDGRIVGQTSSCTFGYRVGKPVGLGYSREPLKDGVRVKTRHRSANAGCHSHYRPALRPPRHAMKGRG